MVPQVGIRSRFSGLRGRFEAETDVILSQIYSVFCKFNAFARLVCKMVSIDKVDLTAIHIYRHT